MLKIVWAFILIILGFLIVYFLVRPKISIMLEDNLEGFDNPLEVKKDMIDEVYAKMYDKVFDEKEMYVIEAKLINDFRATHKCDGYILDVGTGTGKHYQHMSNGNKVVGLERSEAMVNIFKKRNPLGKVILGDMKNEALFGGQKFSMICCLKETLYHNKIIDWDTILSNFYYWLKPKGYLVIHIFDREKLDPAPRYMSINRTDAEGRKHSITNFPNFTHDGWWLKKGNVICQYNEILAIRGKKGQIKNKKHYKHNLVIPKKEKIVEKILGNYFKLVDVVQMSKYGMRDHDLYFFKKIR